MDRLRQLQTFLAILDAGNLAAAARRLGRSPPAITRELADLERRVGVMLIERSTRSCVPTPAGRQLAQHARRLLDDYEETLALPAAADAAITGSLRVTAPTGLGASHVAPLLLSFLDAHPGVRVELLLLDRIVDLVEEDYDLAVRIGRLRDSSLLRRPAGELRRLFVASPAYLAAKGVPNTPSDLGKHDIIQHTDQGNDAPWRFVDAAGVEQTTPLRGQFAVNRPEVAVAAALEGRGIATVLSSHVAGHIRSGRLVSLLNNHEPSALPISIVYPKSRQGWLRIQLLIEHLVENLTVSIS